MEPSLVARASRGLMRARAVCEDGGGSSLPSFRFHWFFRNIEGLWACTAPGCQCDGGERPIGKLYANSRILCENLADPHLVLETLYCEQCGVVFVGGSRLTLRDNTGWELLATDPDVEGIPDRQAARFVDRRNYAEFAVFWSAQQIPLHQDAQGQWRHPASTAAKCCRPVGSCFNGCKKRTRGPRRTAAFVSEWSLGARFHFSLADDCSCRPGAVLCFAGLMPRVRQ